MYKQVSDTMFETDETSDQVLTRAFSWRKGSDMGVTHTVQRLGYHDPLKGRVHHNSLTCADGEKLYRLTVDDAPLLLSDEEEYGGWMTYHQLLCVKEGYERLTNLHLFVEQPDEPE